MKEFMLVVEIPRLEDYQDIFEIVSFGCWINGNEKEAESTYSLLNPSTGELIAHVAEADAALVDEALLSAEDCFKSWRETPASRRSHILHAFADRIRREQETLAYLLCSEAGKPLQAATDEVAGAASLLDYFAEEALRLTGEIPLMGYERERVLIVREPVGVVAAITPYNYPMSTLMTKLGPALACGCTVVAKPDEHTPLSTLTLARIGFQSGLPAGAFNVITGHGQGAGRLIAEHPVPRLLTFTGSTAVGKEIQALGAKWVRRTILELGGSCPAIICRDAPWRDLIPQLVNQTMKNCGQYCYRITRFFVAEELHADFLEAFASEAGKLRTGPATLPEVDLGPLNNREVFDRLKSQVEAAVREGARVVIGGSAPDPGEGGCYYPPTVLADMTPDMAIMREEVFGPVALVRSFREVEEAVREANDTPFGLAAYLFTGDLAGALQWSARLEAGSVWVNRIHQAYPEAPFGGMKQSGLGREKSRFGIEAFTELKSIYLSY